MVSMIAQFASTFSNDEKIDTKCFFVSVFGCKLHRRGHYVCELFASDSHLVGVCGLPAKMLKVVFCREMPSRSCSTCDDWRCLYVSALVRNFARAAHKSSQAHSITSSGSGSHMFGVSILPRTVEVGSSERRLLERHGDVKTSPP